MRKHRGELRDLRLRCEAEAKILEQLNLQFCAAKYIKIRWEVARLEDDGDTFPERFRER